MTTKEPTERRDDTMATSELMTRENGNGAMQIAPEIDIQIATAHRYPRNVKAAIKEAEDLVESSREIAMDCGYIKPVGKKKGVMTFADGPSIRLLEVVQAAYGNIRSSVGIVDRTESCVTVEARAHDMEKNVAHQIQVQRSIVGKYGKFQDSVIDNIIAASCAIALRNVLLKVIPRSLVEQVLRKAEDKALGPAKQQDDTTRLVLKKLVDTYGVPDPLWRQCICVAPDGEISRSQLLMLIKIGTALKDGDMDIEDIFPDAAPTQPKGGNGHAPKTVAVKEEPPRTQSQPQEPPRDFDPENL